MALPKAREIRVGDIFIDESKKLWRVTAVVNEPTVDMEEVEGTVAPSISDSRGASPLVSLNPPYPTIYRNRRTGSVSAPMWDRFTRIWPNGVE